MTVPYLSRVRLRRDLSAAALAPLLLPEDGSEAAAGHHLVWSLFADASNRRRDFLWRALGDNGGFLILSERPPEDRHSLFEVETKPFDVRLAQGDRLAFCLRANPVVTQRVGPRRSKRRDVVMHGLHPVPKGERAVRRAELEFAAGRAWIDGQLASNGAAHVDPDTSLRIDGYAQVRIQRSGGRKPICFSTLDLEGVLEVREPERLVAAIRRGFGKAKAFGCGLMLIRRA